MNRRRRWTSAAAATIAFGVALAGCAPAVENGATVSLPAVVPAPASIDTAQGAPFALDESTRISGADDDAVEALAALVRARTGLDLPTSGTATGEATIELAVSPGGDAESYRISADAASVVITGAASAITLTVSACVATVSRPSMRTDCRASNSTLGYSAT